MSLYFFIFQSGLLPNQALAYKIALFLLLILLVFLAIRLLMTNKRIDSLKEEISVYNDTIKRQGLKLTENNKYIESVNRNIEHLVREELNTLKKSESQLLAALKTANLGFWEWDTTTDEMNFNDHFYNMLGYSPGMIESNTATFVEHIHPNDRNMVAEKMQKCIRSLKNFDAQFRIRNVKNQYIWMLCRAKIAAVNSRNKAVQVIGILLDIDEMHQKEQKIIEQSIQLNQSLKQIELAHKALKVKSERIREYSFMMSYKVRKPLANILGMIQLAKSEDIDMQILSNSAEEMDNIIQDMHRVLGTHIDQIGDEIPVVKP